MRKVFCEPLSREVEVPDNPERIVSLSPAVTEALFMLGLGNRVVGVSAYDFHPPEARKRQVVGSYSTASVSRLRELKPDLVLVITGYQRELALKLSEEFPTYAFELPLSVAGVIDLAVKVGLVTGAYEMARKLERDMIKAVSGLTQGSGKVYIEIDLGGPTAFGAYSYITDAVEMLGYRSVTGDEPAEWLVPSFEMVAMADPDVIVYEPKMFRRIEKAGVIEAFKKRGWGKLRALAEGRVIVTPGPYDFLAHHGPSFVINALPWLSRSLEEALKGPSGAQ